MNDALFLWSKPCDTADLKWGLYMDYELKNPQEEDLLGLFGFFVSNSRSF